jgi:hypothetical protein
VTILSVVLESCFGSAVGNPVATVSTGLISGAVCFAASSVCSLVEGLFWSFVLAVRSSDKRATASVRAAPRVTSAFVDGTAFERSVLETAILTMRVVARPIRHNKASQTVRIACGATMPIVRVPADNAISCHDL